MTDSESLAYSAAWCGGGLLARLNQAGPFLVLASPGSPSIHTHCWDALGGVSRRRSE